MKKLLISVLGCLLTFTSCSNSDASTSKSDTTIQVEKKSYTNKDYKLELNEANKTFVLNQNNTKIIDGHYTVDSIDLLTTLSLSFNEENIQKSFMVTLDNSSFSTPYIDFLKADLKAPTKKYDVNYGLGTTKTGMITLPRPDYYDYILLFENNLCQLVSETSIFEHNIVNMEYANYNLVDDILFINDSHYITINNYAWPVTCNSSYCCNIEQARNNLAGYEILNENVDLIVEHHTYTLSKGYKWYVIRKESYYTTFDDNYDCDLLVITCENTSTFYVKDFSVETEYIRVGDNGFKIFFN